MDFIDDPEASEEIVEDDMEEDLEDDEVAAADDGSQALVRIPRGSRVYTPRVGPRPVSKVPPLNDAPVTELDRFNQKRAPSILYDLFELYETATTVGEARRLGATTGHVRYDVKKGYARLVVEPAIVVFGAAAAPLVETWCDKENPLGTVGDVMGIAEGPRQSGVSSARQPAMHAMDVAVTSQPSSKQPSDQGPHRAHP